MTLSEQVERLRTNIRFYMVENNTEYKADMREKAGKELLVLTATLPARIAATERVVEEIDSHMDIWTPEPVKRAIAAYHEMEGK